MRAKACRGKETARERQSNGADTKLLSLLCVCVCFISGTLHVKALNLYTVWVDGRTQQMEHFHHPVCVCV